MSSETARRGAGVVVWRRWPGCRTRLISSLLCVLAAGFAVAVRPLTAGAAGLPAIHARVHGRDATSTCPWLDQTRPIGQRVKLLLSHMNLAEKIAEMYINEPTSTGPYAGYEGFVPAQPTLCIPPLIEEDGSQGVAFGAADVTQLPAEVSLASAWDPALAYQYGAVNGQEHRAKGIAVVLGPSVNIQRDPRWGRNFEMFSEDPFLTSALGTANIEGLQSQGVMADVKHFVTYNQETNRGTPLDNTKVSVRALHEIYLPPFYSAITQAHAASVMCAYPLLNGLYSCQDPSLLTGLLDDHWGFPGFVRSDSAANASTVDSANAGLDQERGSFYWDNGQLAAAVAAGQVPAATINAAVRRILTEMFQFNLFNAPPTGNLSSPAATPADDAVALNVAERGTVLLQNSGGILPLNASTTHSIAVIGPDGTTSPQTAGGGSSYVRPNSVVSPLSGITARAGSAVAVTSYSGTDPTAAAAAAAQAQVAVVFASYPESEGSDLADISLPDNQDAMIEAVAAANPNTIVVLNTGGPVLMPWLSSVKAVLEAWYPGQDDGTAIAAVLFGDVDPSGHLPETFPTSLAAIPTASPAQFPGVNGQVEYSEGLDVGYRWYDANNVAPLFPFGYGLSYTSFAFSGLQVTPTSVFNGASGPDTPAGQSADLAFVTATVTNTGPVAGSDVAQLYLGDPPSAGEPPRQLVGFRRVTLAPHQSTTVTFPVTGHDLSFFNATANGWTVPAGRFKVYVGDSSALPSLPLHGALQVTRTIGARYAALSTPAAVDPGETFIARARFVNRGNVPISDGIVRFGFPAGWTVVRGAPTRILSLRPGESVTRNFQVTVPNRAGGQVRSLTVSLDEPGLAGPRTLRANPGADLSANLSATATIKVRGPVTVAALAPVIVAPGSTAPVTVVVTSRMNRRVLVHLSPSLPAGVTLTPAAPAVTVPALRTVHLRFTIAVAAGVAPTADQLALIPSFTYRGESYPLEAAALRLEIPYASLAQSYDTAAISDDANVGAANFDGNGNSYSQQALVAAGLAPGATVAVGGTTLAWPAVAAGAPDSTLADGQTILLPPTPGATQLTVLGASSGANETGSGTIQYTDGTVQHYNVTLDDWFNPSAGPSNTAVATAAYINNSTGAGNNGVVGQRRHRAAVFGASIPLLAGKTASSVTLPTVATLPGVFPMHLFALGLGSPTS
ncbi:MAG TPA: glycoside hydrolase family 3 C-terminal domain-containing protein [Solirubrobacteraceae bacterium]|nr:glycoside hydrolase family 3 C-terminal domain-containing protein [Solirubrobacteraceae bacterium]